MGYRKGTRYMFKRQFRHKGVIALSQYLQPLKVGDYVDVVANSSQQKGMPHKYYHGKTGIVYNVTRGAVGVELNKQVRNRVMKKRVNIRVEHIRQSKCRLDFLKRVQSNDEVKRAAKLKGERLPIEAIKRFPLGPKAGFVVKADAGKGLPTVVTPQPFDEMI